MIRVLFSLSRSELRKIVDDDNLWARGFKTKRGELFLGCYGDVDTNTTDSEAHDCFFYVAKEREDWHDMSVKPRLLFKGRTLVTYKKWKEQMADFYKRYNANAFLGDGKDAIKDLL